MQLSRDSQCNSDLCQAHMSIRKALVRFDAINKARIVEEKEEEGRGEEEEKEKEVPRTKSGRVKHSIGKKVKTSKKGKKAKSKLVIHKGQLLIEVPGYKGKQKVQTSKLLQYLPRRKLQQAAKKVLVASGLRPSSKRKKKTVTSRPTSLF